MMRVGFVTVLLAATSATAAVAAPEVQLSLRDGMVWLVARDATVGQVLAEWSRLGEMRVVNAERLTGRVTIEMNGMPEGQALDELLRAAGGFVAMRRSDSAAPIGSSRSQFEAIVITAARDTAPRPVTGSLAVVAQPVVSQPPVFQPSAAVQLAPGVQRVIGADGQPVPDDQEDAPPPVSPGQPRGATLPPGFATPPQAAPVAPAPATGPSVPAGSRVPGVIVPPPAPVPPPVRRPS